MSEKKESLWSLISHNLGVPILLIILLMMTILPVPTIILDILFTFNISLSLLILLGAIYSKRPLDFAGFPTVLLLATVLRLALNVASTRVVLLYGHTGPNAAGDVIHSFGEVVIGGNYTVGFVVFLILMIINFVVVTKGAGRVSEVSARFTLDALPGKQMAIDADLNAGIISQDEAKKIRADVSREADFYGSMDGASKFIRGDAIAGILILFINIIGGVLIGIFEHKLNFLDALQIFALLTIGDGLVAQIPSLLLSIAGAIMVTRETASQDVGTELFKQVLESEKSAYIAGSILVFLGLIPKMPHLPFLLLGGLLISWGWYLQNRDNLHKKDENLGLFENEDSVDKNVGDVSGRNDEANISGGGPKLESSVDDSEINWDSVTCLDRITLKIGFDLIPLVDENRGDATLARKIKGIRKKLSQELGFLIPTVHIQDDLKLSSRQYKVAIAGVEEKEVDIYLDKVLAINPGQVFGEVVGIATKEPSFGLDAFWIDRGLHDKAQNLGYTVVDPSTVIATHLSQIIHQHAYQLLGHEETQKLLDILSNTMPKLVEDLVPKSVTLGVFVKILQNLLKDKVPLRDIRTIAETIIEHAPKTKDSSLLTEYVREAISSLIVQQIHGTHHELPVVTLDTGLEQLFQQTLQNSGPDSFVIEPTLFSKLQKNLTEYVGKQEIMGNAAILLVSPKIRQVLAKMLRQAVRGLSILSYKEVPENKEIKILGSIG